MRQRGERELRQAVRLQIEEITARYQDEIAALEPMIDELQSTRVAASDYAISAHDPHVDESMDN